MNKINKWYKILNDYDNDVFVFTEKNDISLIEAQIIYLWWEDKEKIKEFKGNSAIQKNNTIYYLHLLSGENANKINRFVEAV